MYELIQWHIASMIINIWFCLYYGSMCGLVVYLGTHYVKLNVFYSLYTCTIYSNGIYFPQTTTYRHEVTGNIRACLITHNRLKPFVIYLFSNSKGLSVQWHSYRERAFEESTRAIGQALTPGRVSKPISPRKSCFWAKTRASRKPFHPHCPAPTTRPWPCTLQHLSLMWQKVWELPSCPHWIGLGYTMKTTRSMRSGLWNISYRWTKAYMFDLQQVNRENNKTCKGTASDTSLWLQWNISDGLGCSSNQSESTEGITNRG